MVLTQKTFTPGDFFTIYDDQQEKSTQLTFGGFIGRSFFQLGYDVSEDDEGENWILFSFYGERHLTIASPSDGNTHLKIIDMDVNQNSITFETYFEQDDD